MSMLRRLWNARGPVLQRYFLSYLWPNTCAMLGVLSFAACFGLALYAGTKSSDAFQLWRSYGAAITLFAAFGLYCMSVLIRKPGGETVL